MREDYSGYSVPDIVRMFGERFKDYRLRANLTQKRWQRQRGFLC